MVEPVSVAEVRSHLRVDHTDDDAWISFAIGAARQYIERIQNRAMMRQRWRMTAPSFEKMFWAGVAALSVNPVASIDDVAVAYYDSENSIQSLSSDALVFIGGRIARVALSGDAVLPSTFERPDAVSLSWYAGYSDSSEVPLDTRMAILEHVAQMYHYRDGNARGSVNALRHGLTAMIHSDADWAM